MGKTSTKGSVSIKAITLYQPYAGAIIAGINRFETRNRRTNIRGRIAIHSGKKKYENPFSAFSEEAILFEKMIRSLPKNLLEYGAIIGTVKIIDCVPSLDVFEKLTKREYLLGEYSDGYYAWVLEDPIIFDTPIKIQGKQGWWNWDNSET